MDDTITRGFEVAIENLTTEVRTYRDETREDLKELRTDMAEVKERLTVIETQTSTAQSLNHWGWERFSIITVGLGTVVLAVIAWLDHVGHAIR